MGQNSTGLSSGTLLSDSPDVFLSDHRLLLLSLCVPALYFFPRASERRVLLIVGVCQTFSHLQIFTSSHPHILHITSSNLHILTSSHPHICSSSHFHLHIFTSSHSLLPSCSLALSFFFYFSLEGAGQCQRDGTKRNPFARNDVRSPKTEVILRF